jgi:methylmalonyl-CoA/ethylmalonyl-CoA epimerase
MGAKFRRIGENKAVSFISVIGDNRLEILSPTRPDSDVAKFINKRGEGLYAVGFKTPDAGKARAKVEGTGVRIVGDITDADIINGKGHVRGMSEIWLHPKDVFGVHTLLTQSGDL